MVSAISECKSFLCPFVSIHMFEMSVHDFCGIKHVLYGEKKFEWQRVNSLICERATQFIFMFYFGICCFRCSFTLLPGFCSVVTVTGSVIIH